MSKRLAQKRRVVGLGEKREARAHAVELGPHGFPEIRRHAARVVAAEAVEPVVAQPAHQHFAHVFAQRRIGVVEIGDVDPVRIRRHDASGRVVRVPVRVFADQHRVPRRVVRDDVDEHLHAALVRGGDEVLQIIAGAVFRIDRIVVAHGVGTAERALGLELAHGMYGHQPEHGDAEILQAVELRDDALEVAFLRKGSREYFVDDGVAKPLGALARGWASVRGVRRREAARAARTNERPALTQRSPTR